VRYSGTNLVYANFDFQISFAGQAPVSNTYNKIELLYHGSVVSVISDFGDRPASELVHVGDSVTSVGLSISSLQSILSGNDTITGIGYIDGYGGNDIIAGSLDGTAIVYHEGLLPANVHVEKPATYPDHPVNTLLVNDGILPFRDFDLVALNFEKVIWNQTDSTNQFIWSKQTSTFDSG
jgi:hypothetical protein